MFLQLVVRARCFGQEVLEEATPEQRWALFQAGAFVTGVSCAE